MYNNKLAIVLARVPIFTQTTEGLELDNYVKVQYILNDLLYHLETGK